MEIKATYLGTMIGLATVAFGLIAAGAWNQFIKDAIALVLQPGHGVWAEFVYAVLVTILAIVVMQFLARLAQKEAELKAKLPFGKKDPS
jgi:TRAP-type C4-dicarboxylate transport system permease small subunit